MQTNPNFKKNNDDKNTQANPSFLQGFFGAPTKAKASGLAFSLAVILPQVLAIFFMIFTTGLIKEGETQPDWYLYFNFLLPQISFLFVAVFYLKYTKTPIKRAVESQKCKWKYYMLALFLQFGLLSLSKLNGWFLEFLGNFGYTDSGISLPNMNGFGFVGVLVTVAVLPAIFEEIIFRGILLRGLRAFGEIGSILLCALLFSFYHQNPAQTLYQFCCGVAFAWLALKAGSVLPTVLAHFLNNAVILTLTKFGIESFPNIVEIVLLIASALSLVLVICYILFLEKGRKQEDNTNENTEDKSEKKRFFTSSAVGIAMCVLTWILVLISGI